MRQARRGVATYNRFGEPDMGIIGTILVGFIVGLLARFFFPGTVPLGFWLTVALGIGGSIVGGLIARLFSKPVPGSSFHPAGVSGSIVDELLEQH